MERSSMLEMLSEKTLHQVVNPNLVTYNPTMDLIALVTLDEQVYIYRLNGQRVYGATQKSGSLRVQSIRWKPNGQLLAVSWNDGSIRIISAETTKVVHHFIVGDEASGVTVMGWVSNLVTRKLETVDGSKEAKSWLSVLSDYGSLARKDIDLPRDLALIDIESSLPKLSTLPAGGGLEDVFSSRSSLDAIFRSFKQTSSNAVDVMVVGTKHGGIHLSIYDSFVVGLFDSIGLSSEHAWCPALHASHEQYSTHALLLKSSSTDERLYFVPMDLRFISASSQYLSLLASRSTDLQNLLRYIQQVQSLMIIEWKSMQELPNKFLRNISETLNEQNKDIVQALYHSVATGHAFPAVREWLMDELAERGHKRWDKAVTNGLETLRRLVHENMLPALDRCTVILSRFLGIAKFLGDDETVGFTSEQIEVLIDTVACLHMLSSKILIQIVDELDLFGSFSAWLRFEIDRVASESSSAAEEDMGDKEAMINHSNVLLYLRTAMLNSPLKNFLQESISGEDEEIFDDQSTTIFEQLEKRLQKQEQDTESTEPGVQIDLYCKFLKMRASAVFSQIAEAEKRNVFFGAPTHTSSIVQIAFVPDSSVNQIQITQVYLGMKNEISSTRTVVSASIQLGDGNIKDLKFADNNNLFILWCIGGSTSLLSISTLASPDSKISSPPYAYHIEYSPSQPGGVVPQRNTFTNDEVEELFSRGSISCDNDFIPSRMEIRRRDAGGLRPEDQRFIIISKDGLRYKIFKAKELVLKDDQLVDKDIQMTQ